MANSPGVGFIGRLRGKRTKDIRLPSEGERDPRLPPPSGFEAAREGMERLQAALRPPPRTPKRAAKRTAKR